MVVDSPPSSTANDLPGAPDGYIKVRLLSLSDIDSSRPDGPLEAVAREQLLVADGQGFQHFQTPARHQSRQTAAASAVFTLVSTILGGGVLSLPFALQQCGMVFGGLVLAFSAFISGYSCDLLLGISRAVGKDSYENLALKAFGGVGQLFTVVLLCGLTFLAAVGYVVLLGDLLMPIVELWAGHRAHRFRSWIVSGLIACVLPACYSRTLHSLRFLSVFSFFSVCLCAVCISYRSVVSIGQPHTVFSLQRHQVLNMTVEPNYKMWPDDWFQALYSYPIFGVAFLCHFNALPVHSELSQPTPSNSRFVVSVTMALAGLVYAMVGFMGVVFADTFTCGNILLNFAPDDALISVCRGSLTLVLIGTFPLFILPCRLTLHRLGIYLCCSCSLAGTPPGGMGHAPLDHGRVASATIMGGGGEGGAGGGQAEDVGQGGGADGLACPLLADSTKESSLPLASASDPDFGPRETPPLRSKASESNLKKSSSMIHVYRSRLATDENPGGQQSGLVYVDSFRRPQTNAGPLRDVEPSGKVLYVETTLIVAAILVTALSLDGILLVWTLLGSTVSSCIAFILPASIFIKIQGHKSSCCQLSMAWGLLILSCVTSVACTITTLINLDAPACPEVHYIKEHS